MLLCGTENEFCYAQAILNYKEDIENLDKKLIFEQDGAPSHTSKANTALLNEIFKKNWIQNPPNSPDLAYPIEDLWGILKNRVKRRNPQNIEELTEFMFEEWYSVPQSLIDNLFRSYLARIRKVIELDGARLENEHLKQIKKKVENEEHLWKKQKKYNIIRIYNDEQLLKSKMREIAGLKRVLKSIPKKYKKKLLKIENPIPGRHPGVSTLHKLKNKRLNEAKKKNKYEINQLIQKIEQMDLKAYLEYINGKKQEKKEEEENDDESTIDEPIKRILKLDYIQSKHDDIKYQIAF